MLRINLLFAASLLTILSHLVSLSTVAEGADWEIVPSLGEKVGGSAIFVNRTTGDFNLLQGGTGLRRSFDHTLDVFTRMDGGRICGPSCGPHTGYSLQFSTDGQKIAVFNFWHSGKSGPSGYSVDGGKTWEQFGHAKPGQNRDWEFGAMDWDSKTVLAVPHETNNGLHVSTDSGKTWTELDKIGGDKDILRPEILGVGVLGKALLVGYVDRIERSEDTGKSWTKVSDLSATGHVVKFEGRAWWLTRQSPQNRYQGYARPRRQSVIVSDDDGKTWSTHGTPLPANAQGAWYGPLFGKDQNHIVVVAGRGFYETTDACKTWKLVVRLPDGFDLKWIWRDAAWDPIHHIFYVFNVGKPLMRYQRDGKK